MRSRTQIRSDPVLLSPPCRHLDRGYEGGGGGASGDVV